MQAGVASLLVWSPFLCEGEVRQEMKSALWLEFAPNREAAARIDSIASNTGHQPLLCLKGGLDTKPHIDTHTSFLLFTRFSTEELCCSWQVLTHLPSRGLTRQFDDERLFLQQGRSLGRVEERTDEPRHIQ